MGVQPDEIEKNGCDMRASWVLTACKTSRAQGWGTNSSFSCSEEKDMGARERMQFNTQERIRAPSRPLQLSEPAHMPLDFLLFFICWSENKTKIDFSLKQP